MKVTVSDWWERRLATNNLRSAFIFSAPNPFGPVRAYFLQVIV